MWHGENFIYYLDEHYGQQTWENSIYPKIVDLIRTSLLSVSESMMDRKNTFENFGFDIMIDEDLTPWLIEVNSSPSMQGTTSVSGLLVKELLESIVGLVLGEDTEEVWSHWDNISTLD
jgi:hypothetical protein